MAAITDEMRPTAIAVYQKRYPSTEAATASRMNASRLLGRKTSLTPWKIAGSEPPTMKKTSTVTRCATTTTATADAREAAILRSMDRGGLMVMQRAYWAAAERPTTAPQSGSSLSRPIEPGPTPP